MTRMKRLAVFAVSAAMVFAACGGDDDDANEQTSVEPSDVTDATDSGETGDTTAATDSGDTDEPAPERAERLTLAMGLPSTSFQAPHGEFGNRNLFYQTIYDGLLRIEPDGRTVYPWLATEWSYNDDNTVLTMTLRDDVTFSDGTPFNADAAAQNLIRFRDGNGIAAQNLADMTDAVATDEFTLEITLGAPNPALLTYLAQAAGLMQAPSSFEDPEADQWPIGSGAYVLDRDRTVIDSEYVYTARDDYWSPDTVYYDEIVLRTIPDGQAIVAAMLAGEVNGGNVFNFQSNAELEAAGLDLDQQEQDWAGFSLIDRCGDLGSPLNNLLVRQAISHAVDREAILASFGGGYGTVSGQVFRPGSAGFDESLDSMYPYDVEKAKALMAESGVEPFTLTMPAAFAFFGDAVYAILSDSLAEIGITVEYEEPPIADFISELLTPKYPGYFMFLEQNPNDWAFINFLIAPTAVWNPGGCTDETVSSLVEQIQLSTDDAERDALVADLGRHVIEQAWYVPFYRVAATFATDSDTAVTLQTGNVIPFIWNIKPEG